MPGTNPFGSTTTNSPLPTGWINSGKQLGTTTGSADGTPNGILPGIVVTSTGDVTDANFGINKEPVVEDKTAEEKTNRGGSVLLPVTFANIAGQAVTAELIRKMGPIRLC